MAKYKFNPEFEQIVLGTILSHNDDGCCPAALKRETKFNDRTIRKCLNLLIVKNKIRKSMKGGRFIYQRF